MSTVLNWIEEMKEKQLEEERDPESFKELPYEVMTFEEAYKKITGQKEEKKEEEYTVTYNNSPIAYDANTCSISWDEACGGDSSTTFLVTSNSNQAATISINIEDLVDLGDLEEIVLEEPELEIPEFDFDFKDEPAEEEELKTAPLGLTLETESSDPRFGLLSEIPRK